VSQLTWPVVYSIFINGTQSQEFPLDVELRQTWGQHDIFYVRIEYQKMLVLNNKTLWPDNASVKIIWGQTPGNLNTWYGYVNHHKLNANSDSGSKTMQITYSCIGTSKPMNTDKTRTWGQVTGTYIAKKIASEYGFRAILSSTDWVLPYEVQSNESDFHFMNRIADKIGYRFWVSGGTLYFIDPIVVLEGSGGQAIPKYYMDKSFLYLDTVREFSLDLGDNIPGGPRTARTIYGINEATGKPFSVKANNASYSSNIVHITPEWPVTSINEAQNLVNAWQERSQFWMAATAELYGTSYVYPGKLVYLSGNQLNREAEGYWIVASSDHVMMTSGSHMPQWDKYVTHVQLLKNQSDILPRLKNVTKISPEFTTCQLLNGNWQSNNQAVTYDNAV
jgi:hypothetical protein